MSKAIKSVTTKSGMTIKAEMVREVNDKTANLDGDRYVSGREIYERTYITIIGKDGKVIGRGDGIKKVDPRIPSNRDLIAKGAIARVGDRYVGQDIYDLITGIIAELDAENPKSDEQLAIEAAIAAAKARLAAEQHDIYESKMFERRMDDPHSDLGHVAKLAQTNKCNLYPNAKLPASVLPS